MEFKVFSQDELDAVVDVASSLKRIKARADKFIAGVVALSEEEELTEANCSSFSLETDGSVSVKTPYGDGRITFEFLVDGTLQGRHTVEKQVRNSEGTFSWVPVWTISTNSRGVFLANSEKAYNFEGPQSESVYWFTLNCIIYAIATGPVRV